MDAVEDTIRTVEDESDKAQMELASHNIDAACQEYFIAPTTIVLSGYFHQHLHDVYFGAINTTCNVSTDFSDAMHDQVKEINSK